MQQNHYRLLDVHFSATRKEITRAYHKQMRKWHPDRFQGTDKTLAENFAKELNQAYSVLSNPKKREDYDQSLRVEEIQSQIMERYVAGSSSWNLGGRGPMPADAPRRARTAQERREQRIADRDAFRSLVVSFALLAVLGIVLLVIFTILETALGVIP